MADTVVERLAQRLDLAPRSPEGVSDLAMARARRALATAGEAVPHLLTKAELARALNTTPAQIDRLRRKHPDFPCEAVGEQSPRFDLAKCRSFLQERSKTANRGTESPLAGVERISRRA